MRLRRVVGMLLAGTLAAGCSGAPGAARTDAGTGGAASGGGAAGSVDARAGREGGDSGGAGGADASESDAVAAVDATPDTDTATRDTAGDDGASPVDADGGAVVRAAGCGMAAPPLPVPAPVGGPSVQFHIMTTGATLAGLQPEKAQPRSYWVSVPADYDPNRPYRTVFETGYCQGSTAQPATVSLSNTVYGGTDQAIYVVIGVPETGSPTSCYDTNSGLASGELEAFALVHDAVAARYCVDEDRVFVVSRGRSVANQVGCYFGGKPNPSRPFGRALHVRGQALVTGDGEPAEQPPCDGPVAAIWFDDTQGLPPQMSSAASFARVLAQDGCTASGVQLWHTFPCRAAVGCPAGAPVVACALVFGRTAQEPLTVKMFETFMEEASPASSP